MRKKFLKTLLVILIIPVIIFVGCSNKQLPSINLSRYLKNEMSVKRNGVAEAKTENLSLITNKKLDTNNFSQYLKFEIITDGVWSYKMYVEKICFYVYCNKSSEFQMTVNVKMSNLAEESVLLESKTETVESEDHEEQISLTPVANQAVKCTVFINKTIANAFGSTITIDVYNSPELFSLEGEQSNFMWLIYDFEIFGESRTYSK